MKMISVNKAFVSKDARNSYLLRVPGENVEIWFPKKLVMTDGACSALILKVNPSWNFHGEKMATRESCDVAGQKLIDSFEVFNWWHQV